MIFGPDYSRLMPMLAALLPLALLLFWLGYWLGCRCVGIRPAARRLAAVVALQWTLSVPLQFILGWQLAQWVAEPHWLGWAAVPVAAWSLAGLAAVRLLLCQSWSRVMIVVAVATSLGIVGTIAVFWVVVLR